MEAHPASTPLAPAPAETDETTLTRCITRADRLQELLRLREQELAAWRELMRLTADRVTLEHELGLDCSWRSPLSTFVHDQLEADRAFQKRLAEAGRTP